MSVCSFKRVPVAVCERVHVPNVIVLSACYSPVTENFKGPVIDNCIAATAPELFFTARKAPRSDDGCRLSNSPAGADFGANAS